ncbi:NlpC/P60 family protein [Roseibium algae]|uniref:NlpC/P60 family protein n=1 Tax=Roseibium algae TaxID=3123038 RepID=A0ABU8TRM0_9HYPH
MADIFDRRFHPVRPDLASIDYEGKVVADRFVEGSLRTIHADFIDIRPKPDLEVAIDTQALHGETVKVFDETAEGWAWGQLETDGYVGWFRSDCLAPHRNGTHRVRALRTYRYPGPDLKRPPVGLISMGSAVVVVGEATTRGLDYALLSDGSAVVKGHLVLMDQTESDWVSVAEEFIGTPYLWGGRTSLGLDCSALVQISAQVARISLQRDSDVMEVDVGEAVSFDALAELQRGDLVFWKGHVGIINAENSLLHANGHTMTVAIEPLDIAVDRISKNEWGAVSSVRRVSLPD